MDDTMQAFMAENANRSKEVEYVASTAFKDSEGNPIPWRIAVLDQTIMDNMRKKCQKVEVDLKTRQKTVITDTDKLNDMLVERCVVFPNLNNAKLQESYGVIGAIALVKAMLLPGEYTDLLQAILAANGFESALADQIRRVKN